MKTFIYKACLFIMFIGCSFTVSAQSDSLQIDSLKKVLATEKEDTNKVITLNILSDLLGDQDNFADALLYAKQSLALATKTGFGYGTGYAEYLTGSYILVQYQNFAESVEHLLIAVNILKKYNSKSLIAGCYKSLGYAYSSNASLPDAIDYFYKSLRIYEQINDKEHIEEILVNLGNIYLKYSGSDSDALTNLNASVKISEQVNDGVDIAYANVMIARILTRKKRYPEALQKLLVCLKTYKDSAARWPPWGMPVCLQAIGKVYESQGDSALAAGNKNFSAVKYKNAARAYIQANAYGLVQLGNLYIKTGNLKAAREILNECFTNAEKMQDKSALANLYHSLATLDSMEGNFKGSDENFRKYIRIRDSLYNNENDKKILQTKLQYDFDKKESVVKAEQDKKDADAKRVKNQQYFAIAALGIVVLAVLVIALIQFRNNKQKQKANIALQHQKEKVESTLTELKSTQAQLIQSEKMASLGELTAGIAHEIQNPLNFVNNFSDVNKELVDELEQEADKGNIDEVKAIAKDIRDNEEKINHHGKRADAIVKGMLQHSRQSSGKKEPTDINALCNEYLRLSYHGLRAKDKSLNADFKTDFDESIGKINIIPQDIGRVLLNLFNNAFYAVNEKAKLTANGYQPTAEVKTRRINEKVEIIVSDNGNGIPSNIIDKIFQPFFTTKPTGQGTGLGLSLVYDIITKEYNGTIRVESKEGERSKFIIQLPVTA